MLKEALCRPDDIHWCIECCPGTCPLLGDLGNEKKGCLGHDGKTSDGLSERFACRIVDCLDPYEDQSKVRMRQMIMGLPPGRFEMSDILLRYNKAESTTN